MRKLKFQFFGIRCSLYGCERAVEYRLDDGRLICGMHAGYFYAGAVLAQKYNQKKENDLVQNLVEGDLEELREEREAGFPDEPGDPRAKLT